VLGQACAAITPDLNAVRVTIEAADVITADVITSPAQP
jgi:hypothetical protein